MRTRYSHTWKYQREQLALLRIAVFSEDKREFDSILHRIDNINDSTRGPVVEHDITWTPLQMCIWNLARHNPRSLLSLNLENDCYFLKQVIEKGANLNVFGSELDMYIHDVYQGVSDLYYPIIGRLFLRHGITWKATISTEKEDENNPLCLYLQRYLKMLPFLVARGKFPDSLKYIIFSFLQ